MCYFVILFSIILLSPSFSSHIANVFFHLSFLFFPTFFLYGELLEPF